MALDEFSLIKAFFKTKIHLRKDIVVGIGDDCAVLNPPLGQQLLVSTDTLNVGSHFFSDTPGFDIGYKACAVSVSDIAAMGGDPAWMLLSLTLPHVDEDWLTDFCNGIDACIDPLRITLVGGNTTRGPLSITTTIIGFSTGKILTRVGSQPGDLIYVTGYLGDAGLALGILNNKISLPYTLEQKNRLTARLFRPMPRINEGKLLCNFARAAIDISDGLVADLTHLLEDSGLGATLYLSQLPVSAELQRVAEPERYHLALSAGDDYELCFTLPPQAEPSFRAMWQSHHGKVSCIGQVDSERGLRIKKEDGSLFSIERAGYQHF